MVISKWERLGEAVFSRRGREVQDSWRTLTSPKGKADNGVQTKHWKLPVGGKTGNAKELVDACLEKGVTSVTRSLSQKPSLSFHSSLGPSRSSNARGTDIALLCVYLPLEFKLILHGLTQCSITGQVGSGRSTVSSARESLVSFQTDELLSSSSTPCCAKEEARR